jgi:two-component system, sensor histidine kinase YesM
MNLITKIMLIICMLMVPVILLNAYSNRQSEQVVTEQINLANQNRLAQFMGEIESTMEQFGSYSNVIMRDPDFARFAGDTVPKSGYAYAELLESVERKLSMFSVASHWMNRISLYSPLSGRAASSHSQLTYDEDLLAERLQANWHLREIALNGLPKRAFTRHYVEPYAGFTDLSKAAIVVEVDLMEDNIVAKLDSFKSKGNNDPFLITGDGEFVLNATSDSAITRRVAAVYAQEGEASVSGQRTIELDDKKYGVYYLHSPELDMTLIDYVPLEDILAPLNRSQLLFNLTVALLVVLGAVAGILLYVNVQVPIRLLTESVERLRGGHFSERIASRTNREFARLIERFNDMAAQIQHLVEKVYLEELRAKEAVMKQLQSQINPHFLYNSIAYIISMVKMNRPQQALTMGYTLADYYKYTTRNHAMATTLGEELAFVTAYMDIMNYQLDKFQYTVDVEEDMLDMRIPRLLVQPLVENAIVHGLEGKLGQGSIRIVGRKLPEGYELVVEDDGIGMPGEQLAVLNARIAQPELDGESFGLWNVCQRLRYQYGESACLAMQPAGGGGVRAVMQWHAATSNSDSESGERE